MIEITEFLTRLLSRTKDERKVYVKFKDGTSIRIVSVTGSDIVYDYNSNSGQSTWTPSTNRHYLHEVTKVGVLVKGYTHSITLTNKNNPLCIEVMPVNICD